MGWRIALFAACLAWFGTAATAQTPPRSHTFENVIRLGTGQTFRASGEVSRGDVVIAFPFEYRRTGVLRNDVRGTGRFALRILYAAAGTPGFLVGEFSTLGSTSGTPMWCFERPADQRRRADESSERFVCLFGSIAASVPMYFWSPPLIITSFSMNASGNNTAEPVVVDEGPVELPLDLRLEYRMGRWRREWLVLDLYASGERVGPFSVPREPDGSATLYTVAGAIRFTETQGKAVATPVDEIAPTVMDQPEIAALLSDRGAFTVESALRAVAPPPTTGSVTTVARNSEVFTQRVQSDALIRIEQPPNGDDRYGPPGALLFPGMRGNSRVICRPVLGRGQRSYCLQDTNNDGAYDVMWPNAVFAGVDGVLLTNTGSPGQRLRVPVAATVAPDAARPELTLSLRYIGPVRERRDDAGALRATAVGFVWSSAGWVGNFGPTYQFEVELNETGEGVIAGHDGTALGRIRNVSVATGSAEILIDAGFPSDSFTYLSGRTYDANTTASEP
jgi:hypothetical protein